jgi:hypothetical protein
MSKSHKVCQRIHLRKRLKERYGLDTSNRDIDLIEEYVRTGKTRVIRYESMGRSIHAININGNTVVVVYSKFYDSVVTALTKRPSDG